MVKQMKLEVMLENSEICADLKRNKVSCAEIIDFSYEALKEVLDK